MVEEERANSVFQAIRKNVEDYYSRLKLASMGDAFAYWYLINRFRFSELEASDAVAMSGPNDKGIDAVLFDDDSRQVYCFQLKYSEDGKASFGFEDATKLRSSLEYLKDKSLLDKVESGPLFDALTSIHERRDAGYDILFYIVVMGSMTNEARKEIDDINKKNKDIAQILFQDSSYIAEFLPIPSNVPEIDLMLAIHNGEWYEHEDKRYSSLVMTVDAKELGGIHRQHGSSLFARNVRYFLGSRGANKGMVDTLQNRQERPQFWFFHNGVTAVCDKYDVNRDEGKVTVKNFQIVNGCQTTVTLSEALASYLEDDIPPTLMLRIIRTKEDEEFLRRISKYTNTQNPIKQHDLCSNDAIQKHVQAEFKSMGWYYQRARGEWTALKTSEKAKYMTPDGRARVLVNVDVAKAMMAFLGYAAEAKTKKQMHFFHSSVGGYYDIIFDPKNSVWEYLLAYNILDYCERRRKEFQAEFRDAEKGGFDGLDEEQVEELKAKEFLSHSETHVAALIGEITKERVAPAHYDKLCRVFETGDPKAISYMHGLIEEILTQFFLEKMKGHDFQLSKYFKSPKSWNEVRSSVRSQMRILAKMAERDPIQAFSQMLVSEGVPA